MLRSISCPRVALISSLSQVSRCLDGKLWGRGRGRYPEQRITPFGERGGSRTGTSVTVETLGSDPGDGCRTEGSPRLGGEGGVGVDWRKSRSSSGFNEERPWSERDWV